MALPTPCSDKRGIHCKLIGKSGPRSCIIGTFQVESLVEQGFGWPLPSVPADATSELQAAAGGRCLNLTLSKCPDHGSLCEALQQLCDSLG